jgi:hypothetical protein
MRPVGWDPAGLYRDHRVVVRAEPGDEPTAAAVQK